MYEKNNNIIKYEVEGHAKDTRICAIVSVITQSPILTISDKFKLNDKDFKYTLEYGYSNIELPFNNSIIEVIMKHMKTTLLAIEAQYPNEVQIKEVHCD